MKIKDLENSKFKRLIIYREVLEMFSYKYLKITCNLITLN